MAMSRRISSSRSRILVGLREMEAVVGTAEPSRAAEMAEISLGRWRKRSLSAGERSVRRDTGGGGGESRAGRAETREVPRCHGIGGVT